MASCNPPTFPSSTFLQLFLAPSKIQPKRFLKNEEIFLYQTKTTNISIGWWFQPIWKTCSSNWIISPGIRVKVKHLWSCHHLENIWKKTSHRLTPYHPCNGIFFTTWMVDFYGFSCSINILYQSHGTGMGTLRESNIAMENPPFEDVFPIENGDFPLLCLFTGGYQKTRSQAPPPSQRLPIAQYVPRSSLGLLKAWWLPAPWWSRDEFVACWKSWITGKKRGNQNGVGING